MQYKENKYEYGTISNENNFYNELWATGERAIYKKKKQKKNTRVTKWQPDKTRMKNSQEWTRIQFSICHARAVKQCVKWKIDINIDSIKINEMKFKIYSSYN